MAQFPSIGMSPSVWGPIFWTTMHIVSLGYADTPSKEEQSAAVQFYRSLESVIPCPICKSHYSHFLAEMPVEDAVANRQSLIRWVFDIHNKVNEKLGKPQLTFAQYVTHMRALSQQSHIQIPPPTLTPLTMIVGGVGLIAGAAAVYYLRR